MCLSTPTQADAAPAATASTSSSNCSNSCTMRNNNNNNITEKTNNNNDNNNDCLQVDNNIFDNNNTIDKTTLRHRKLNDNEDEVNSVYKEIPRNDHDDAAKDAHEVQEQEEEEVEYIPKLRWPDLIAQTFLHVGGLYGLYLLFSAKFYTFLWVVVTIWVSGIGITAGVHRLWSHKSYTASLPLRILLVLLFTIAGQRDAYTWALDHRIHHKFSETDADPHNAKRGFFFAHVGWLFLTPHPKVIEKRKVIDMSDLENDQVVMFQRKYFIPLFALFTIGLPVLVPWYFWNEDLWMSFWINFNMRFCCTLNSAFFVNSVAHMWGRKPYDKNISPVESPIVSFMALGEGWHNYHHVFPWDYKTGEFGTYALNVTTLFIDVCAKLGLAKARKSVSPDMVLRRAAKCGDGSRFLSDEFAHKDQVWGYGDRDLPIEDAAELAKMKD